MKGVPVTAEMCRVREESSLPQARTQPAECKAVRSGPHGRPRQPDLTVTPHKRKLRQQD